MNQKALKTLEYDKIIEQLASYASSPLGRKKCLEARSFFFPFPDYADAARDTRRAHPAL